MPSEKLRPLPRTVRPSRTNSAANFSSRRSKNVAFVDVVFEGCAQGGTDEAQAIIEVTGCEADAPGVITLRRVVFRKNELNAASVLRTSSPSCFTVELIDVEISENVGSDAARIVHLAKKNRLKNCAVFKNAVSGAAVKPSSVFYGPASSETTIQGLAAFDNSLTLIQIQDGSLAVSNASVERNLLATGIAKKRENCCFHLVRSSAQVRECSFRANEGVRGTAIFARESTVSVLESGFDDNVGLEDGSCVYAENSEVVLEDTNAIGNQADGRGGVMYAANSTVIVKHTTAVNSSSKRGGFLFAWNSTLNILQSQFISSVANVYGGFAAASKGSLIFIVDSAVERAKSKNGGAIWLKESHLVARNLSILYGQADESGGGVYGFASSTIFCSDCKLYNNSAKGGNGGAIFFDTDLEYSLALQLVKCHIEKNVANLGGRHPPAL